MTAQEIVEMLLGESVFVGNNGRPKGYLGYVDICHGITAQWSNDIIATDHSEMGRKPDSYRWRYAVNRAVPTVLWTTDHPTGEAKVALEDWLDRKGLQVAGHTTDFNRWSGY